MLSKLSCLELCDNAISRKIPTQMRWMTNLVTCWLDRDALTGSLDTLSIPPFLWHLSVHNNALSGTLPADLCKLTNLEHFWVNNNTISGTIPSQLGLMTNVKCIAAYLITFLGLCPAKLGS